MKQIGQQFNFYDRREVEIPFDTEVLVIWKGRWGILWREKEAIYMATAPAIYFEVMRMDEECFEKIDYWAFLPEPLYRCDIDGV